MDSAAAAKTELRRSARLRRDASALALPNAAVALADCAIAALPIEAGTIVAGYWPIGSEIDPRPLLHRLAETQLCALPVIAADQSLEFHLWRPGFELAVGRYGIPTPPMDLQPLRPDIVLVPLLAFDGRGNRLGYGGGHYDRTLARLRSTGAVLAAGLAFGDQQFPLLPVKDWDQRLDLVVTERGVVRFDT
jgi:5-formyltetrahydrofolate cyclo-ligase